MMRTNSPHGAPRAFSLVEVLLATGIFTITIIAMLGLLGPTLKSVSRLNEKTVATSVVSKVETYLESERFEDVYNFIQSGEEQVLYAYSLTDQNVTEEKVAALAQFRTDLNAAANDVKSIAEGGKAITGEILKIFLAPSLVNPDVEESGSLPSYESFTEGFLALEIGVYSLPDLDPEALLAFLDDPERSARQNLTPLFIYNTAVTR